MMSKVDTGGGLAPTVPPGWTAPRAVGGDAEGAVGLKGSSTLVGLQFESIASAATGFGVSVPIAGKVALELIRIEVGNSSGVENPHRFQLALTTELPANQAGLDAGEQLFPQACQLGASKHCLLAFGGTRVWFVRVTTIVAMNGRRFACGWYNGSIAACDAYVLLGVHRVLGGSGGGDPSFLSGEPVVDW